MLSPWVVLPTKENVASLMISPSRMCAFRCNNSILFSYARTTEQNKYGIGSITRPASPRGGRALLQDTGELALARSLHEAGRVHVISKVMGPRNKEVKEETSSSGDEREPDGRVTSSQGPGSMSDPGKDA